MCVYCVEMVGVHLCVCVGALCVCVYCVEMVGVHLCVHLCVYFCVCLV